MKCPKCGSELEEGKLLCEKCGEEVKIVPEFDIELEDKMKETISSMLQNIAVEVQAEDKVTVESGYEFDDDIKDEISDYFPNEPIKAYMYVSSPVCAITGIVYLGKRHELKDWEL